MTVLSLALLRLRKLVRLLLPGRDVRRSARMIRRHGAFDRRFYRATHPGLHPIFRLAPLRHYLLWGEAAGLQPNRTFSPADHIARHPNLTDHGTSPLVHFLTCGPSGARGTRGAPDPDPATLPLRFDQERPRAPVAVHLHLYYPDLWPEFEDRLAALTCPYDLYVTLTQRGEVTTQLADKISFAFPSAHIAVLPNRGRDILPFVALINAGAFDGYQAVCKLHGKKSPHREDGDQWRHRLIDGILPPSGLVRSLSRFLADDTAAIWVADGQSYRLRDWWGGNRTMVRDLLRRIEMPPDQGVARFPAGSVYWIKPIMIGMIRSLGLTEEMFEPERGQVDGTLAHAVERGIGLIAASAGLAIRETRHLLPASPPRPAPQYVSAFYLPQFHPIPENDRWWGRGFTEWRGVAAAGPAFPGHLQPLRPADLGYYDLRVTEVMGQQAALARDAGIDAFCVYHYWFDGHRLLETPLDRLLDRQEVDFPFYLCWANESWRRSWDGLSGEVLVRQSYAPGFEESLVASTLPYMRDPRYQRPDGRRPRFVIYRPEDMPAPEQNIARLRRGWREAGIGPVELGAVCFHIDGPNAVPEGVFDFWVEMPPHGVVTADAYLFGGPAGDRMGDAGPGPGFSGLIYDYRAAAQRALSPHYRSRLPERTIAGIMPSWDNTARRGAQAHIACGGNPAAFRGWLTGLCDGPLAQSYRQELMINAWNEWAEKAVMEPSDVFGRLNLEILAEATGRSRHVQRGEEANG